MPSLVSVWTTVGCTLFWVSMHLTLPALDFNYHNYTALTHYMHQVAAEFPDIVKLHSIGQSVEKRELWVLEISLHTKPQNNSLGIPNVKLIGNIHGNEPAGRELILHFIEFLVMNYPHNQTVAWLLNNTRMHLLPSMNPDGFEVSPPGSCDGGRLGNGIGRTNRNAMDLNRNFPDYFSPNLKPIQPETLRIQQWLNETQFVLSASLHGGALVANYPYDNTRQSVWETAVNLLDGTENDSEVKEIMNDIGLQYVECLTPDNDVFRHLALVYSKTHPTMHQGQPCMEHHKSFPDGITNGAAWYSFVGGMQDFNYYAHGCMEITLEISCCKYPPAKELPQIWRDNKEAILAFVSQAHRGVHGVVRDSVTQVPISGVKFKVNNRSMGFQSNENGEFWRILLPGRYYIEVYKASYEPLTVPFVVHEATHGARLNATWLTLNMSTVSLDDADRQHTEQPTVSTQDDTDLTEQQTAAVQDDTTETITTQDMMTDTHDDYKAFDSEARTFTSSGVTIETCSLILVLAMAVCNVNTNI